MSRVIKFRAWDLEEDVVKKPPRLYDFEELCNHDFVPGDPMVGLHFEQFTGLHDKDGKEIYEGDIVECENKYISPIHSPTRRSGTYTSIAVVFWGEDSWRKRWGTERSTDHDPMYAPHNISMKVIGNIHENPELKEELNAADKSG